MPNHKIYIKRQRQGLGCNVMAPLLRRAIRSALKVEGVEVPCEVYVLITDDENIRKYNREHRNIDAATDVLSFPLQDLVPGAFEADPLEINPDTGCLPLGDIILSMDHIVAQAKEYGHSDAREAVYLTVHSVMHLLGYDHLDEGPEKARMRAREKAALREISMDR